MSNKESSNNDLIESFDTLRECLDNFFIYGFNTRSEITSKSQRTVDEYRHKIRNWLGPMYNPTFNEKNALNAIHIDSRNSDPNPLYIPLKMKSYNPRDYSIFFSILTKMSDDEYYTLNELYSNLIFEDLSDITRRTLERHIEKYVELGLVVEKRNGRIKSYKLSDCDIDLEEWVDAITFFSEMNILGAIGSYCLDRYSDSVRYFRYKHRYLFRAFDQVLLYKLISAIENRKTIVFKTDKVNDELTKIYPCKIYIGVQQGRINLLYQDAVSRKYKFQRIDKIKEIEIIDEPFSIDQESLNSFQQFLWGITLFAKKPEHVEIVFEINENEKHILRRLNSEKRNGTVERIKGNKYRFTVDTYSPKDMIPWIRTFIGRIVSIESTDIKFIKRYNDSLNKLFDMYDIRN